MSFIHASRASAQSVQFLTSSLGAWLVFAWQWRLCEGPLGVLVRVVVAVAATNMRNCSCDWVDV